MSTNKLDCGIVRELLALYHEGILGEQASAAVKEHVEECAECAVKLKETESELPVGETEVDTGKSFVKFAKRRKRKHRLLNILCFVIGGLIVAAAIVYFALWDKKIVPCPPDSWSNEGLMVYHYKYDDCPYKRDRAHYSNEDHALFVYMEEPYFTDWEVVREGSNVNLQFKRPIWNPKLREQYAMGTRYRISIIPIDDSCETLSINGKWVCDIGEPNVNLPPYVEAYHELESKATGMWEELFIDEEVLEEAWNKPPCDFFAYYPDGNDTDRYIKWDTDGNEVENTLE